MTRVKRWFAYAPSRTVYSPLRAISYVGVSRLCVRTPSGPWHHQVPRVPLPDIGVTFIRETLIASCGDITPRSWLLRTHASIPSGSPLLQPKLRSRSLCRLLPVPAAGGTFPTIGIELGRANGKVEGYQPRPFGCEVGSHFHQRHVSRGPPIIPDSRVSQVRFEVLAYRQ
jgi:hypothetical protein